MRVGKFTVSSGFYLRHRRRRNFRLNAAPADRLALHGAHYRAEQHEVHHLTVVETLQQQRPQQGPVFMPFESECDDARQKIDQHESDKENERALYVRARIELRQMREVEKGSSI